MFKNIFPDTAERVKLHTNCKNNQSIREETIRNIARYTDRTKEEIETRIKELDREWDIERVLETNAAGIVLLSAILGFTVNKKWFLLTGLVGGFLLQHALQGWCPPLPLFRRIGIRTASEIENEKAILKYLKGDLDEFTQNPT